METVAISEFKARCLAILKRIKRTGQPILITRFGEPVAEVMPATRGAGKESWVGAMIGTAETVGDIVSPVAGPKAWTALGE